MAGGKVDELIILFITVDVFVTKQSSIHSVLQVANDSDAGAGKEIGVYCIALHRGTRQLVLENLIPDGLQTRGFIEQES